jgi:hypothetical protein
MAPQAHRTSRPENDDSSAEREAIPRVSDTGPIPAAVQRRWLRHGGIMVAILLTGGTGNHFLENILFTDTPSRLKEGDQRMGKIEKDAEDRRQIAATDHDAIIKIQAEVRNVSQNVERLLYLIDGANPNHAALRGRPSTLDP